jgi:hypothetical protein
MKHAILIIPFATAKRVELAEVEDEATISDPPMAETLPSKTICSYQGRQYH